MNEWVHCWSGYVIGIAAQVRAYRTNHLMSMYVGPMVYSLWQQSLGKENTCCSTPNIHVEDIWRAAGPCCIHIGIGIIYSLCIYVVSSSSQWYIFCGSMMENVNGLKGGYSFGCLMKTFWTKVHPISFSNVTRLYWAILAIQAITHSVSGIIIRLFCFWFPFCRARPTTTLQNPSEFHPFARAAVTV